MGNGFNKWDIIYATKFPETIHCAGCGRDVSINQKQDCVCGKPLSVSKIVSKPRPVLLWVGQGSWYQSISFGIPLSTSSMIEDSYNEIINLKDCIFTHPDTKYYRPMRAIVHQASRVDGTALKKTNLIGRLNDLTRQSIIENKLFNWLFPE